MHNDDMPRGRILTRREILGLMTAAGGALAFGAGTSVLRAAQTAAAPSCVVVPESTEGPYFVEQSLHRSDIRAEPSTGAMKEGAPLVLTFSVAQIGGGTCAPLAGAAVDLWQCDAMGAYSGFNDNNFGNMSGQKFLRGVQTTDRNGIARFTTIYPGWYPGRPVHVHFKIRTSPAAQSAYEFTSQLYFDEGMTDRVHASAPYTAHQGRRMLNTRDRFFNRQLILAVDETPQGYASQFGIGLDLSNAGIGRAD
jgi:protocatechuate 3,4-dioxygenase beta subunit